jgi:hypothetical protein
LQAKFPANTNILYVDLASAELVGSSKNENSLPGMVLNTKKPVAYVDDFGKRLRYIFHPKLVASVLKFTFLLLIYLLMAVFCMNIT